ncbi:MAG: crotonase/enoyl-CoA hydratase family protein [Acidimicrobiales bacterium]
MSDLNEVNEETVLVERRGRVLLVTLNRPNAMNAINNSLSTGLARAIELLDSDSTLTVGILSGAGRGFCAGMDLKAFVRGEDISSFMKFVVHGSKKPLIAAVEGFALAGGFEMALSCDLIVAAKGSKLGIPEVKVGLFAAGGGLARLPSRAGYAKAMEMALTGESILAEEAVELGIASRLADPGGAVAVAMELAERIAANAPLAVAASKGLIKATTGLTEAEFWKVQALREDRVFTSNDSREGAKAFAEKRAPIWTGS